MMRKIMKLLLAGMLFVSGCGIAEVLYSDDFEGATNGFVRNITLADGAGKTDSGGALYFEDTDAAAATYLEFNFSDQNYEALHISYDLYNNNAALLGSEQAVVFGIGPYSVSSSSVLNSTDDRACGVWVYTGDGTKTEHDVKLKGASVEAKTKYVEQTKFTYDLFANDSDSQTIPYSRPDGLSGTLRPNTIALFLNNTLVGENTLRSLVATGDATMGRGIFYSGTSYAAAEFYIDNLLVETLDSSGGTTTPVSSKLLTVDFEGQTVGQQPSGASTLRPTISTADEFVHIIGSALNTVGTGDAVEFKDNGAVNGSMLTYNFVSDANAQLSAVRVDFSFALLSTNGLGDDYIAVAVGEYSTAKTFNSHAARYTDLRLYNDGTVDFNRHSAVGGPYSLGNVLSMTSNSVSIFVNDYDVQAITYVGLDDSEYLLPANSVAYWLNGSLILMNGGEEYLNIDTVDSTDGGAGTVGTTENNLGKFGFNTASADVELDCLIDDIAITAITNSSGSGTETNAAPAELNEILSADFEIGQTVGAAPTGATIVRPSANTVDGYTEIVAGSINSAGEGNGVRIYDVNALDGNMLTYNFVSDANSQLSAVRVDFSFAALSAPGVGDDYIAVALGAYNISKAMNSSAARYTDMRLCNDGTVDFRNADLDQPYSLGNAALAGTNTVSIIANDSNIDSIDYTGIDSNVYTLAANSVAYWLNGSLVIMNGGQQYTALDLADPTTAGTIGTTDYNLGKFGFNTGSSDISLDWVIDDIKIFEFIGDTNIPTVSVHNLFQNHMMLQRDMAAPVWGTASTGTTVSIYLDEVEIGSSVTDTNGDWMVQMPSHATDAGTVHSLKISVAGAQEIILSDVIYGDVYLCSGQSNMAFGMSSITNYDAISSTLTNELIRHVNVERAYSETLLNEPGRYHYVWECGDDLADVRHFTAIGYLVALEIQAEIGVPVGLLHSSYGGKEINMFLNTEGLELVPELSGLLADQAQGGATDLHDIYNAMIGPLVPYGICGILWYQGESDRDKPAVYEQKLRALVRGWRAAWNLGDLPFYNVQLPNYAPGDQTYQLIREAQLNALTEVNSGMAVTIDVGDDTNIHPINKQDPSWRLAQWVLAGTYGQDIAFSGPLMFGAELEGTQIRVLFDHVESGLMIGQKPGTNPVVEVTSGNLENFEIAGTDGVFISASAVIDLDSVVVSAPSVASPQYVRYCYAEAPAGLNKLYNKEGFPASPFRTDQSSVLQVINGTGSQEEVAPETVIAISADAPATGKVFDRWVGAVGAVADVNSSSTTITMPTRGVYLVATYRDSAVSAYTLTVNNGTGSSTAQAGTAVMIQAAAAPVGQVFSAWAGDTSALVDPSAETATVIVPAANVTVTATYTPVPGVDSADLAVRGFAVLPGGGVGFSFPNSIGYRYEIASTTNLVSGLWETRIYNLLGTGEEERILFSADDEAARYYRIKVK